MLFPNYMFWENVIHRGKKDIYISINHPEYLHIKDQDAVSYGANQIWYRDEWQRRAGCGPTTAAMIFWYFAQSRPDVCSGLFIMDKHDREEMIALMEEVWHYVTPTKMGVNKSSIFTDGAITYGKERGLVIYTHVLEVPEEKTSRPKVPEVQKFLNEAFSEDLPVAFLNLSNGEVENLDNWHWVTLIGTDQKLQAVTYDQSICQTIDLAEWLDTTTLGGAFVCLDIGKD